MRTTELKGIDISRWQGESFSVSAAKNKGAKYVIARCMTGEFPGDGMDSQWENYYKQAKECGMPIGAYVFGCADTVSDAVREAEEAVSILRGKRLDYPVFYDVEHKTMLKCTKRQLTDIIKMFCSTMRAAGYKVGIYSSTSMFNHSFFDGELSGYYHWVADWRGFKPSLASGNRVDIWQTGSEKNWQGSIEVDQDICYTDFANNNKSSSDIADKLDDIIKRTTELKEELKKKGVI